MFKKLELNIPFLKAISQMPNYAKFLNEIVANKKRLEEYAMVASPKSVVQLIWTNTLKNSRIQRAL